MESILFKLQKTIKVKFKNIELLKKAITHKSFDSINNYEKLEFLGDRLLGLIISKKLLSMYPDVKEGLLDKKLASLVNKEKCYEVGKKLKLDEFILIGNNKTNPIAVKIINRFGNPCIPTDRKNPTNINSLKLNSDFAKALDLV